MPGGSIYEDIVKTLETNGEMDDEQYRRVVLFALVDLGRGRKAIDEIKKKVEKLERNSILLIAKRYPKASITGIVFMTIITISVIIRLELWHWLFDLIGIPMP